MAKITGPLYSVDAQGNWGKGVLQFRRGLKTTHAYRPAPPGRINQAPATPAQARSRQAYGLAKERWTLLSLSEQAEWNAIAEPHRMSGWNLFVQNEILTALATQQLRIAITIGSPPLATDLTRNPDYPPTHKRLDFNRFLA